MVVDAGSRGPMWIFCLGPQQTVGNTTGQGADGAAAHTNENRRLSTLCIFKQLNESYSFNAGNVSCASSQDWHVQSRTSCHVSNSEWQGGGRNTGEVTAPESLPGHQGAVGGSLWCINQTPCGTMRGPELQAGPEAAGSDMETQGDPACATPLPQPVTTRLSSSAAKLHSPPPLSSAN